MAASPPLLQSQTLQVTASEPAGRIDRWLADHLPGFSRSKLQALIADGHVRVDGLTIDDPSRRIRGGETVEVDVPPPLPAEPEPQAMALDVVFEDEHLIVVNKPAGLVVHPGPGNPDRTLVNALLAHCGNSLKGIGGVARPGIVHRIDKDTSGLLVAAKTEDAHAGLSTQLAQHSMRRTYDAIVWGCPRPPRGTVTGSIARSRHDRKKMAIVRSGGKAAETNYAVTERFGLAAALLACRLKTGRTHQIRVHMSAIGHGLIGDPVYGTPPARVAKLLEPEAARFAKSFPRQALHARELGFVHPVSGATVLFERSMPPDMSTLVDVLAEGTN